MAVLVDTGEEFNKKYIFEGSVTKPANLQVGLYDDSTDGIADADDVGAITTEPTDGNYVRQDVAFDGTGFTAAQPGGAGTPWQASTANSVTFDTTDTTGTVDHYFVVVSFQAEGEDSANNHLYWTGELSQSYDLANLDQLDIGTSPGVGLDQD